VLSNGETGRFFLYASEVFSETFSEGSTGFPDVESRAATARDAVNLVAGMAAEMFIDVDGTIRAVNS